MSDDPELAASIQRLAAFRASWNPGDEICEECHLTPEDIDLVLASAKRGARAVGIRMIDVADFHKLGDN